MFRGRVFSQNFTIAIMSVKISHFKVEKSECGKNRGWASVHHAKKGSNAMVKSVARDARKINCQILVASVSLWPKVNSWNGI